MLLTSESVGEGHPDKLADQISDAILDQYLTHDPNSLVACECCVTTSFALIAGEITSNATMDRDIDIESIVRDTVQKVGYSSEELGMDYRTMYIDNKLHSQSADIHQAVIKGDNIGAGDQGIMYGYASSETPEYMPAPIMYAHKLMMQAAQVKELHPWMGPDKKCQITMEYNNANPVRIASIVFSQQHKEENSQQSIAEHIKHQVINPVLGQTGLLDSRTTYYINPSGKFIIGGPHGDAGLTGRKLMVDTYGGVAHHGGGAFSGKDPSKVDRSGAYMARKIAKNIVAAQLAQRCEVQLSYVIGVPEPSSVWVNTFDTHKVETESIVRAVKEVFDLSPLGIIQELNLQKPIYLPTATFGHFGRPQFSWEACDKVTALQNAIK